MSTTIQLDFAKLPRYQKRAFVADDADLTQLEQVTKYLKQLLEAPIGSAKDLEMWLIKRSELGSVLDQQGSTLYIQMTCQTDNEEKAQKYTQFIETIPPVVKPLDDELNKKFLRAVKEFGVDHDRYGVLLRGIQTEIELYREENVPLQTKLELLSQEYQKICGAMTVKFDGEEKTLPQMQKFLQEPNRELREKAWRATAARRLEDKEELENIFDEMLRLRHEVSQNAGFTNYRDYRFRSLQRFDYTPKDCYQFHSSVEKLVIPVWKKIVEYRRQQMKLTSLRPWNMAVDPFNRAALKPFTQAQELIDKCQIIFDKVNPKLGAQFRDMANAGLLDLSSRKGKAPGGYQSTLNEARKPFIFMNAVGVDDDVRTLLHEAGHAFHALASVDEPLLEYRHAPMEFCEVASMSMELLGGEYLSAFYTKEEEKRSLISHLEDVVSVLIWVATVDSFQHWIYENFEAPSQKRTQTWLNIRKRFGSGLTDWSGLDQEHQFMWHRQLHIFEVPFYYIEYGIAQLGALQIWLHSQNDWAQALQFYRQALALGGSRPLPELFKAAGMEFDFSEKIIAPLMKAVEAKLEKLYA
jgi:oligoendopeptidase F